jgi:prepilin-type N-terminal cleavage/methylation domain-containing protein
MLRKLNQKKSGFTLVEIMIVVAIIALLATIAVPNFLRSRKRAQATAVLEEIRLVDGAKDTYAIENNKSGGDDASFALLVPYLKPGSRLANSGGNDIFGNKIGLTTVDGPVTVDPATLAEFDTTVIPNPDSFWGSYQ